MPSFAISDLLAQDLRRWTRTALVCGGVLLLLTAVGGFISPPDFFRSWLLGYLFFIGITLGSLAILMLQYLTGGAWGVVSRRTLEAATRTLPLLAILFIPIAFGLPALYDWAHPELVARVDVLRHRAPWMNPAMFLIRTVVYFAVWIVLAWLANKWSADEDAGQPRLSQLRRLSAAGLILWVFTVTFSSIDWAESLTTHWYSTMWGFLFVAMQTLSAMAFTILILAMLSNKPPLADVLKPVHFHDMGKLLLMFVMLWAYFSFSQLLIVWAGDLNSEITWYLRRMSTSWGWVGGALIVLQFIIPFLLLLSRPLKRKRSLLSGVAGLILVMRFFELLWIVMPGFAQRGFRLHWLNIAAPLAIGGLWFGAFLQQLGKRPLLPEHALNLEAAIHHAEA